MTGGGWRSVTKSGGSQEGAGGMNYDTDMPPYAQRMADWIADDKSVHPCCFAHAWQGFEMMSGMYRSAADGGQVALPLNTGADEIELLKKAVPDRKPMPTGAE